MKKTILLVHGLRGNHKGLSDVAKLLEEKGFNVKNIDLPGSGTRAELDDKTLDGYAEWFHDFVTKMPEKPYIIGHSMGSIVVSHYVDKYPDDVQKKVVFLSPIFRKKFGQRTSNISYAVASGFLHLMPKKTRYRFMKSKPVSYCISHFLTIDKSQQKRIDELHYKYSGRFASADSLLADMKISMKQQTILPQKKEVMFIYGDHDRLVKAKLTRAKMVEFGTKSFEISHSGHLINYERPTEIANAITSFIGYNISK